MPLWLDSEGVLHLDPPIVRCCSGGIETMGRIDLAAHRPAKTRGASRCATTLVRGSQIPEAPPRGAFLSTRRPVVSVSCDPKFSVVAALKEVKRQAASLADDEAGHSISGTSAAQQPSNPWVVRMPVKRPPPWGRKGVTRIHQL
ncbi:MAG TPA: hypothetical protein VHB77_17205 [Planctomycetaceae bacterium]|nr:hypothetical protein [Planctomycetaceae bacterium]